MFAPRTTGWGCHADHQAILANFWPKGTWSLKNSSTLGIPGTWWMFPEARAKYTKYSSNKKSRK
jgi:hypothetical protein